MTFSSLGSSDHGVVSFPLIFHQIHNTMSRYIALAYDHSHADQHSLHDHLRDAPWEEMLHSL